MRDADVDNGEVMASWRKWLVSHALPLWSGAGFDSRRGLYHERLSWNGEPVAMAELRLMVQARQVATYCRAALDGIYDASAEALRCLHTMERLYYRRDDQPGWIFSLAPDDGAASSMRDLYAHAFILFAYGWAIRFADEPCHRAMARRTAEEIGIIFAAENGGFQGAVPPPDALMRQNPHMHLLEAYLVLFDVTREDFYLDQARMIVRLALEHLVDARSGLLLEFFDALWVPSEPFGRNRVEPGHLFEWTWLFHEYERLAAPDASEKAQLGQITERFFQVALANGCDPVSGMAFDAMTDDRVVIERSTRIWPQTEMLRLINRRRNLGKADDLPSGRLTATFLNRYLPAHLKGGWIDRLDVTGLRLVDHMPASSLYHIYGAAQETHAID